VAGCNDADVTASRDSIELLVVANDEFARRLRLVGPDDWRRPTPCSEWDVMRPLRYSINVTLDGCCDHRAMFADEELDRHAVENIEQADALLFSRVTYEMMEAAWRQPARTGVASGPSSAKEAA